MIDQSKLYSDEQCRGKWVISGFKFLNYEGKRGRGEEGFNESDE